MWKLEDESYIFAYYLYGSCSYSWFQGNKQWPSVILSNSGKTHNDTISNGFLKGMCRRNLEICVTKSEPINGNFFLFCYFCHLAETSIYYFNYLSKTPTKEITINFVKFRPNSQRPHHQLFYLVRPLLATLPGCMCECKEEFLFLFFKKNPNWMVLKLY